MIKLISDKHVPALVDGVGKKKSALGENFLGIRDLLLLRLLNVQLNGKANQYRVLLH